MRLGHPPGLLFPCPEGRRDAAPLSMLLAAPFSLSGGEEGIGSEADLANLTSKQNFQAGDKKLEKSGNLWHTGNTGENGLTLP